MIITVAVDGSNESLKAFNAASVIFDNAASAYLRVIHVCSMDKDKVIPFEMRGESVSQFYLNKLTRFPSKNAKFILHHKSAEIETRTALMEALSKSDKLDGKTDILFVGIVGRKGIKEEPTLLGKTADYSLRSARTSSCIVRTGDVKYDNRDTPLVFVVGLDGSTRSHQALLQAQVMAGKNDKIYALHIDDKNSAAAIANGSTVDNNELKKFDDDNIVSKYKAYCSEMNANNGPNVVNVHGGINSSLPAKHYIMEFKEGSKNANESISSALIRIADDLGAHFLCVGIDGASAFAKKGDSRDGEAVRMGSVSDDVVRKAIHCNVVCVQPQNQSFE